MDMLFIYGPSPSNEILSFYSFFNEKRKWEDLETSSGMSLFELEEQVSSELKLEFS
jgi:hypothetical protein